MSIGTLHAKFIVNDATRVRYGSNDPISGYVVLTFAPRDKTRQTAAGELFGPLKVCIVLSGDSNIKMWRKLRHSYTYSRSQQPLFSISSTIYDEPFRSEAGKSHQFPFVIYFPQNIESSSTSGWTENVRFPVDTAKVLPPAFSDKPSGIQGRLESSVEYRLGVSVDMPGLKLDISQPENDDRPIILYERPQLFRPLEPSWKKFAFDVGKDLGPYWHSDRACEGSRPFWHSVLTCEAPQDLYCGQLATFKVRMEFRMLRAPQFTVGLRHPNAYLTAFGVKLRATTAVRGKRRLLAQPQMSVQTSVATLICAVDSTTPFKESEDWTKRVITGKIPSVPSTFNSMNISRLYHVELKFVLQCDGKTAEPISRSYGVVVHPPLEARSNETTTSSPLAGTRAGSNVLPEYERPPEYEDTVNEGD